MAIGKGGKTIWFTSLVSSRTGEGVVELTWGEMRAQLSVQQAREHALGVLEVAEAAEADAFMVEFFEKDLGMPREKALAVLVAFRGYREKRRKEKQN
jgi:hypothetical protein